MFEFELSEEQMKDLKFQGNGIPAEEMEKITKVPKDVTTFLVTETNTVYKAFPFKNEGKLRFIPEPDPVLIYFHAAYVNYIHIDKKKKEIFKLLEDVKLTEGITNQLYEYFGLVSGFVIFLFTSMEAFMNRAVPVDYIYRKVLTTKTEEYSKHQIEECLPFEEKLKIVIPRITKKDFIKHYRLKYDMIFNLKEFRDSIVHTKTSKEGNIGYDYLYKRAFKFHYRDTLNAVADFINFYHVNPDYIQDCPCSNNW